MRRADGSAVVVAKTRACGRRLVLLNRHPLSARRDLTVSGLPGTGKTMVAAESARFLGLPVRPRRT